MQIMKKLSLALAILWGQLFLFFPLSFAESEYTMGGHYHFNGQNTLSKAPTLDFGMAVVGSLFFDETHEIGIMVKYNINWEENSQGTPLSEALVFSPSLFYRYHFFVTGDNASFPVMVYLGPEFGVYKLHHPFTASGPNVGGGLSLGFHLFISRDTSLDVVLISAHRVLSIRREIFHQSLGIRFYF